MRQLLSGEVTLHLLDCGVAASFDLANSLADLLPFPGAQLDVGQNTVDRPEYDYFFKVLEVLNE
jgi:hypothetical protein